MRRKDSPSQLPAPVLEPVAGNAAHEIIKTIHSNMSEMYNIVGIIDDNAKRLGYTVSGVRIIGNRNDIVKICEENKIDLIFFSIARIDNENKKQILNICQQTKAKVRILPGMKEIIKDKKLFENLRDVEIEDLLGREPIKVNMEEMSGYIEERTVLVTGGGGSIGSELCRQIASFNPKHLVILDNYENNAYAIQQELIRKYGDKLNLKTIIASIREEVRMEEVFNTYRPEDSHLVSAWG